MAPTSGHLLISAIALLACALSPALGQQILQQDNEIGSGGYARLLDRFDNRYPDGSYEYRFELDDGTARYERGYFAKVNEVKTLMVVGYYAYRMTDGRYITVFYNADQFGYRQNQSITPQVYPNLPRSIEVPTAVKDSSSPSAPVATPSKLATIPPRGAGPGAGTGTGSRGRY
ncbi:hypothetical protein KR018_005183 [Drosophila ironensis]|nr:hypothetical protein KR018_005183 [Drosophila ironensis]